MDCYQNIINLKFLDQYQTTMSTKPLALKVNFRHDQKP